MKMNVYLIKYSVSGYKNLANLVELGYYKKTIDKTFDIHDYNLKAIYGMNGSGKTAIIESVLLLQNLALNNLYLSSEVTQHNLKESINKFTKSAFIEMEFVISKNETMLIYKYTIQLGLNALNQYVIKNEALSFKNAFNRSSKFKLFYEVNDGICKFNVGDNKEESVFSQLISNTKNLLHRATLLSLMAENVVNSRIDDKDESNSEYFSMLCQVYLSFFKISVFQQSTDDHFFYMFTKRLEFNSLAKLPDEDIVSSYIGDVSKQINQLKTSNNSIKIDDYDSFSKKIEQLTKFIKVFKNELISIEIDKKIDGEYYYCDLIMCYKDYKIHSEYESTGIKKLIKLFTYFSEMVDGGIVFIDELDANLHDVYLCSLLQYLKEFGKGQLTFTTHNVGPMEILKKSKKSIDFLSLDNRIYSWVKNGNYSPIALYKEGMIQGSPFNVDYSDFIGIFDKGDN